LIDKVGLTPIEPYIRNLDLRCYGRNMIIKYIQKLEGIGQNQPQVNITEVVE